MATVHEDQITFVLIPRWILLRMRHVSDKSCTESQAHTFYVQELHSPPLPESRAVNEIMWENNVQPNRS